MNQKSTNLSKEQIIDIANAFKKSKVLLTAIELDLFTLLDKNPLSIKEITFELNTEYRATEKLIKCLIENELLNINNEICSNTEHSEMYLSKKSNEFLEELEELNSHWEDWNFIKDSIYVGHLNKEKKLYKLVYNKVNPDVLNEVVKHEPKNVLELGVKFASSVSGFINNSTNEPKIRAFDTPEKIQKVMKILGKSNEKNIEFIAGSYIEEDYGSGYDLVVSSQLLERHSLKENLAILKKVYSSLQKGGKFVLHEKLIADDRKVTKDNMYHSIELMINTKSGELYTQADIAVLFAEVGFTSLRKGELLNNEAIFTAIK
jgi:predicted transcriptional regulator/phospholipid N-methyltransferase